MRSLTLHLKVLITVLVLLGIMVTAYQIFFLGIPVTEDETDDLWNIDAKVEFVASSKDPVKVQMFVPPLNRDYVSLNESFISNNYGVSVNRADGNRRVTWSARRASGNQTLYYRLVLTKRYSAEKAKIKGPTFRDSLAVEGPEKVAAEALMAPIRQHSADVETFVGETIKRVNNLNDEVTLFKEGDEVFYAGAIDRPGSYSEYHLVDERIVGHKPRSLDNASAAALPLTSITAWELLFDRLGVQENGGQGQNLLVIGAGGGVGSILVQLARQLTQLTVIGTASRPETQAWVEQLGAHHVIDHSQPFAAQLERLQLGPIDHVISLTHTGSYLPQIVDVLRPQGQLALIDDPEQLDIMPLKRKSLSVHWELMFTRSLYHTDDMIEQHRLLERVSALIDEGVIKTTLGEHFGTIDANNLKRAHALLESGKAKGKIVLEGF